MADLPHRVVSDTQSTLNFESLRNAVPTYTDTLPTGNVRDGMEIYYPADPDDGVIWHLRYRAAATGSYKWEFVGGGPLAVTILTSETTTSTSFADLTTTGPSITTPLAGDYRIAFGFTGTHPDNGGVALASVYAGTTAVENDTIALSGDTDTMYFSPARTIVKTGLGSSATVKVQYRVGGGTGTFFRRWIEVTPIRLG